MSLILDETTQLQRVEADLLHAFRTLPEAVVCQEVRTGMADFEDARIRTYIPVLLQRRVRERLRELC